MFDLRNVFVGFSWSRRAALLSVAATAAVAGFAIVAAQPSLAQEKGPAEVPVAELMKATDLPEISLSPTDAKVTVVEYGSMTCGHCAHFTNNVFPDFKKKYIDSGKVRYVFREFPLDNLASAASMLARCAGGDKMLPLIETYYAKQADWAFVHYATGEEELYSLADDPGQVHNLATLPKERNRLDTMRGRARATCVPAPPGFAW